MPRRRRRLSLVLALGAVLATAGLAAGCGSSSSGKTVEQAKVVVRDGEPVGGIKTFRFKHGGTIDLTVQSDSAQDVHLHGYDIHKDVAKGGSVTFRVPAKIEGVFDVELEDSGTQIASVEVVP